MQTPSENDLMVDDKTQLATLLWRLQLTNLEAAAYAGVHERTIYKWLSGERAVSKVAMKLFELLLKQKRAKK